MIAIYKCKSFFIFANFSVELILMMKKPLYEVRQINNFRELLYQSAELFADKAAFWVRAQKGEFRSITYSHFKDDVDALGAALLSLGLENSFIAVMGENRYEWCV